MSKSPKPRAGSGSGEQTAERAPASEEHDEGVRTSDDEDRGDKAKGDVEEQAVVL